MSVVFSGSRLYLNLGIKAIRKHYSYRNFYTLVLGIPKPFVRMGIKEEIPTYIDDFSKVQNK